MRDKAKQHLEKVILPFWKALKDEEQGGFYGEVGYDLSVHTGAVKGCILNARILWFFSNAYTVAKDEASLDYAKHAYQFLKRYALDKTYGGVYWSLESDGKPHDTLKHTYNQAFQIYALSAYYEATRDEEVLEVAYDLFKTIEKQCRSNLGYNESFTQDFTPSSNEKLSDNKEVTETGIIASKTMNTILHVLEAYTEFYRVTQDETIRTCLVDLLNLVETKIYNADKQQLEVFFDEAYNSIVDMHSFGHDIEAAWLVDRACEVLGDEVLRKKFKEINLKIVDKVIEVAFEEHLLYNERIGSDVDKTRVWWVQAETVVGLINAYQQSGKLTYLEKAQATFEYILDKVVDSRAGSEWHWQLDEKDNDCAEKPIVEEWKCPYHNGRPRFIF